jgi:DNA-binding response OmpR family regulator
MSGKGPIRLGIIDTDTGFVQVLTKRLEALGWSFEVITRPLSAEVLAAQRLSAVVVDLRLYGGKAWDALEHLSEEMPGLGIVVCTAEAGVAARVRGLRLGADDWMNKPCHPAEVIARVEAVSRRRREAMPRIAPEAISHGEIEVRPEQFQAFVAGQQLDLTRREFELLHLFSGSVGQVMQREDLYERIWGYSMAHGDRSVDVFVRKIRQKLEAASPGWAYLHTHFGIGYRFEPELRGDTTPASPESEADRSDPTPAPAPAR